MWKRCDAPEAIETIAALGKAIIGGDVWSVRRNKLREDTLKLQEPSCVFLIDIQNKNQLTKSVIFSIEIQVYLDIIALDALFRYWLSSW
ncbi:MAG: hypothetical protein MRK02_02155 [Candidatus Scalindua sp.]|nr:hypothetical protein [Candidatus Scalindua sp.]